MFWVHPMYMPSQGQRSLWHWNPGPGLGTFFFKRKPALVKALVCTAPWPHPARPFVPKPAKEAGARPKAATKPKVKAKARPAKTVPAQTPPPSSKRQRKSWGNASLTDQCWRHRAMTLTLFMLNRSACAVFHTNFWGFRADGLLSILAIATCPGHSGSHLNQHFLVLWVARGSKWQCVLNTRCLTIVLWTIQC